MNHLLEIIESDQKYFSQRKTFRICKKKLLTIEWAENAKSYRIKNYYPARPLHGCPESAHNGFGQIGPNTFCQAASKAYVVSYSSKTWDLEAVFQISGFQWTKIILCLICYVYGPPKLHNKVWGHAASHEASRSLSDFQQPVHKWQVN